MDEKPDIVATLEYYARLAGKDIHLKKTSGKVQIHCPFHEDSHPSASVNLETGRFRCYANCGALPDDRYSSGDSYDVIMKQEGIGFSEAQQWARDHIRYEGREVHPASSPGRYRPSFSTDDD